MSVYGYARASVSGETLDSQIEALRAAGCVRIFRETGAGAKAGRSQLRRALDALVHGDVLVVTRLDRLARSTLALLSILGEIIDKGAGFRSLGDGWADTTGPRSRPTTTVVRGLAAFQRELMRARTRNGRDRAQAHGRHLGRRPILTAHQRTEALEALALGAVTQADVARRFAVSQSTISRLAATAVAVPAPPASRLDAETRRAARAFLDRIEGKYAVTDAILYGSRARGDHSPDSDADVAVVLEGTPSKRARTQAAVDWAGIAFDVLLETGVKVNGFPFWAQELAHPETFSNPPLIDNILRDGVHL